MTRLLLGAYHQVGIDVLRLAMAADGIDDIAVVTHEPQLPGTPDIRPVAGGLGVWTTTDSLNEAQLPFEPDVISLVYYRRIVSKAVIDRVDGRIFNLHPSLLPRHRGASSVPWTIIEGDDVTGITYHYVDERVDTGDILLQLATPVRETETQASLYSRLMGLGAAGWRAALELVISGVPGVPQHGDVCVHPRGVPHDGIIDPSWSREQVERFVRALHYPPLPPAHFRGAPISSLEDFDEVVSRDPR